MPREVEQKSDTESSADSNAEDWEMGDGMKEGDRAGRCIHRVRRFLNQGVELQQSGRIVQPGDGRALRLDVHPFGSLAATNPEQLVRSRVEGP